MKTISLIDLILFDQEFHNHSVKEDYLYIMNILKYLLY